MKILIAPNSFKECADSVTIASLFKKYLQLYFTSGAGISDVTFLEKPISDGGDGFLNVCKNNFDLEIRTHEITYPYSDEKFECEYGVYKGTVYIESAKVLGLNIIPPTKRKPLYLSSKGLGELLQVISENKNDRVKRVVIGIGGTGTNDFGLGLCSVFGLKLKDKNNNELMPLPIHYRNISKISPKTKTFAIDMEVVIDVTSPLLGEKGASRVYGPQKGATPEDIEILESGFENIVNVLQNQDPNFNLDDIYGAGGGLAGSLHYFLNANYILAKDFIRNEIGINSNTINADIIITGEGTFDKQSVNDKGAMVVINEFQSTGKPIILCCGILEDDKIISKAKNVCFIELSKYFNSRDESIKNIEKGIQLASKEISEICRSHKYIS